MDEYEICPNCNGTGVDLDNVPCDVCDADGVLWN